MVNKFKNIKDIKILYYNIKYTKSSKDYYNIIFSKFSII